MLENSRVGYLFLNPQFQLFFLIFFLWKFLYFTSKRIGSLYLEILAPLYFLLLESRRNVLRECTCVADFGGFPLISPLVSWIPPILYPLPPRYLPDDGVESPPEVPSSRFDSPFLRFPLGRVYFTDYAPARVQSFDIFSRCINALRPPSSSLHIKYVVPYFSEGTEESINCRLSRFAVPKSVFATNRSPRDTSNSSSSAVFLSSSWSSRSKTETETLESLSLSAGGEIDGHRATNTCWEKRDKSAGRNVESSRIASENSSHTKPVSHTDSETREPTVQFSDRRPYSLVQFTDSLGCTDSRRTRTYTRDFPPTAGQIAHCQRTPRVRRSAGRNRHPSCQTRHFNSIRVY